MIVVEPEKPLPGRPWAWRGEFFGAFPNADIELVKRGWHLAYIGVPDLFGSPKAMKHWEKFYDVLVKDHGLSPKPALIGLSRGALYCMAWAAAHPDKTLLVYLDNGVCDFKSWPGGKPKGLGSGQGSPEEWQKLLKAYDFKDDREAIASKVNPVDNLAPLAKAKIPILLVYGDSDKVVPHKENSEVVYDRYKALGGPVERIVKPGQDHHPHGLTDPRPIVEFFEKVRRKARHFRMGFTGFPHDILDRSRRPAHGSSPARTPTSSPTTSRACRGRNCWTDKPFSDELINEWKGKKEATPEGGKVYLAISPGRGDLKPGEKSLPFPKELVGKSYDDPVVMKAYLGYCRRMVEFFKPDYLAIGIEVNEIYQAGPDKWRAYAALAPARLPGTQEGPPGLADLRLVHAPRDAQPDRSQAGRRCSRRSVRSCPTTISSPSASTRSSGAARRTSTAACGGSPITSMVTRSRMRSWRSGSPPSG